MAENENKNIQAAEQLPEGFRPIVPEPELRRRSVYGFSKDFPEEDSPTSTHTISFARQEARRRLRNRIVFALIVAAVFVLSFVLTDAAIRISKQPLPQSPAQTAQTTITP